MKHPTPSCKDNHDQYKYNFCSKLLDRFNEHHQSCVVVIRCMFMPLTKLTTCVSCIKLNFVITQSSINSVVVEQSSSTLLMILKPN